MLCQKLEATFGTAVCIYVERYNIGVALNILFSALMDEACSWWTLFLMFALHNKHLFSFFQGLQLLLQATFFFLVQCTLCACTSNSNTYVVVSHVYISELLTQHDCRECNRDDERYSVVN